MNQLTKLTPDFLVAAGAFTRSPSDSADFTQALASWRNVGGLPTRAAGKRSGPVDMVPGLSDALGLPKAERIARLEELHLDVDRLGMVAAQVLTELGRPESYSVGQ